MLRFLLSITLGILLGAGAGLVFGWQIAPRETPTSTLADLDRRYQERYTVNVAAGYLRDADVLGAVERLRLLGVDNVPLHVQEVAERYISLSRNVEEIRLLVTLAEGLGRMTPIMEPYRLISPPGASGEAGS